MRFVPLVWIATLALTAGSAHAVSAPRVVPVGTPMLSFSALRPATSAPAPKVAGGYFGLTPPGCAGSACTGFRLSNEEDFGDKVNTAKFAPAAASWPLDLSQGEALVEVGTVRLTNGNFMQPTGAGMPLVTMRGEILASAMPAAGSPRPTAAPLPFNFRVMWTLGSPAAVNTAGVFALVTRQPPPVFDFSAPPGAKGGAATPLTLKLVGFLPHPSLGKGVTILGDWGQPEPNAGEPGPRVHVAPGAGEQVLKLYGVVTKKA